MEVFFYGAMLVGYMLGYFFMFSVPYVIIQKLTNNSIKMKTIFFGGIGLFLIVYNISY
jgi:hypothetical protein